ncbi:hypothetical protein M8997_002440 [Phyllobacterium sp. 21LDTY02-6]|uniref:hypothetical protein n=1 Tax=Phyllobacterium sp. 21LDTY02-6 TaxID=2944903 RepID=UPI00202181CF|nr:hypothetical protein [Phyllobacterium sp. 21LDTY02-6]MCO4316029.1 hypothetical protein [Phyllobacterium sp. 21LDTY02-6]
MRLISMERIGAILVLSLTLLAAPTQAEETWPTPPLEELRKLLTGATLTGEIKAQPPYNFSEYLAEDGTSRGRMIECCKPDQLLTKGISYSGEWALSEEGLCLTYEGEEKKICWTLQVKDDRFRMVDKHFGPIGEGTIRAGNPDNL